MAYKHPDRWRPDEWRKHFESVQSMRKRQWQAWVKCPNCGARSNLNLAQVELELGPEFSLWGRRPRCRTIACGRRLWIWVQPPHVTKPFKLEGDRQAVIPLPKRGAAANDG